MATAIDVYKDWLGIPEGPRPPDHYTLLRLVQFEDDPEKVRKNYRKLNAHVRKYATGQHSVRSQELLNELAKAMLCLTDAERKREYDESLGRVSEVREDVLGRRPMEDVLVAKGIITPEQKREAQAFAEARGLFMRDAVVQMKLTDIETATKAYAQELGRSYVDLNEMMPDDSVLDRVPRSVVKRNAILPLFVDNDMLLVACADEPTPELEEELRLRFGIPMRAVLATPLAINQAIAKYYAPGQRSDSAPEVVATQSKSKKGGKAAKKAATPSAPLTEEQKRERFLYGVIFMCWGVVLPILLDNFLLKPYVMPDALRHPLLPLTSLVIAPAVVAWVLLVYWKQK